MNQGLLCRWLSVDAKAWPPDPCTLLGLPQGSSDLAQIEKCVHERMARLRCYQLSHPEEATEGMNRLAQAFVCLSEAAARRQSGSAGPCPPANGAAANGAAANGAAANGAAANGAARPKVSDDTAVGKKTIIDWQSAPPPVRRPGESGSMPGLSTSGAAASATADAAVGSSAVGFVGSSAAASGTVTEAAPSVPASPDPTAPVDDVPTAAPFMPPPCPPLPAGAEEAEQLTQSAVARTGIATVEALIERIYHTRRLLVAWQRAGAFLGDKERMAADAAEREVSKHLRAIDRSLDSFPPILGAPGKPGYRVAAMARLKMTASMLRGADELHRELLVRDWEAGRRVLLAYRRFLHMQFKLMRRHGPMRFFGRAVRFFLNDHPVLTATGALLVAGASLGLYWILSR